LTATCARKRLFGPVKPDDDTCIYSVEKFTVSHDAGTAIVV
jgi:hypothetical protein